MTLFEVWIEGTSALLMHRFGELAEAESRKNTRRTHLIEESPRTVAERSAYRTPDGALYVPGASIARLLSDAGSSHKQRGSRRSLRYIVPAAVRVLDDAIPLYDVRRARPLVEFEVDARPVTIPATKGRIMRFRPRLDQWTARAHIRVNDELIAAATVRQLLVEGGQQVGIGDYRPQRGGPFGTFDVVSWQAAEAPSRAPSTLDPAA